MGTIPVVPAFPAGYAAQGAQLQQLCTAITWLLSGKPVTELQQLSAQSIANSTATAVTWDTKVTDRDGGWSSGSNSRYTAQTPGYYLLAANTCFASSSSGIRAAQFQVTTGPGNPLGAGLTTAFCGPSLKPPSGQPACVTLKSLTPYMYAGDYVQVLATQTSGGSLSTAVSGTGAPSWFTIMLASG